jgi:8-oxo-dGTP diphosphatase
MSERIPKPIAVERRYPPCPLVGVGVVVLNKAGQVLLVKRGRPPRQGQWSLPGGLIDLGERLVEAARREVFEECGIEVQIGDLVAAFEPIEWDEAGRVEYHYVVLDYWAEYVSGEATAQDDAAEVIWIDLAALETLALLSETHQVILRAAQQRADNLKLGLGYP